MKVERSEVVLRLSKNEAADMLRVMTDARRALSRELEAQGREKKQRESEGQQLGMRCKNENIAFLYWLEKALRGTSHVPMASDMSRGNALAYEVALTAVKDQLSEEDTDPLPIARAVERVDTLLNIKPSSPMPQTAAQLADELTECKCDCCDDPGKVLIRGHGIFCTAHAAECVEKIRITNKEARAMAVQEQEDCATHNTPPPPEEAQQAARFVDTLNKALPPTKCLIEVAPGVKATMADVPRCCVCGVRYVPGAETFTLLRGMWYCYEHDGSKKRQQFMVYVMRTRAPLSEPAALALRVSHHAAAAVEYPFMLNAGDLVKIDDGGMWGEFAGHTPTAVETEEELLLLWRVGWVLPVDKERRETRYRTDARTVKTRWFTVGEPDAQNFLRVAPYVDTERARDFFTAVLTHLDSKNITNALKRDSPSPPSAGAFAREAHLRMTDALSILEHPHTLCARLEAVAMYVLLSYSEAQRELEAEKQRSSALRQRTVKVERGNHNASYRGTFDHHA